jgi:5,10-methylenetetrahydromethanopterin reductase
MVPLMRRRIGNDRVRIVVGAVTVVDEDGVAARRLARERAALYFPVVAELDPTLDLPEGLVEAVREAGAPIPDDLLDRFAFSGTPEQVAAQAEALYDAGAHRVEFGTTSESVIKLLAERVLPRLR